MYWTIPAQLNLTEICFYAIATFSDISGFQFACFSFVSVNASSGLSSFSMFIALKFIKHLTCPKFMIKCCLREGLCECVVCEFVSVSVCTALSSFSMLIALNNSVKCVPHFIFSFMNVYLSLKGAYHF